jgi:hypothetical protein
MCDGQLYSIPYLSFEEEERILSFSRYHGRKKYGEVERVGRRIMLNLVLCNGKCLKVV